MWSNGSIAITGGAGCESLGHTKLQALTENFLQIRIALHHLARSYESEPLSQCYCAVPVYCDTLTTSYVFVNVNLFLV